jgi:hypothetical protein
MIPTTNAGKKLAGVLIPTPLLKPVFPPFSLMHYNLPYPEVLLGTSQGTTWEHDGNTLGTSQGTTWEHDGNT